MRISVIYKGKFRMGDMTLRRFLMITCDMFLREHLSNIRRIYLLGSVMGIVDSIGDEI